MTGLTQLVTQPTRGPSTLDLIWTNCPSSFGRVETMPWLSDHDIVFTELDINTQRAKQKPRDIPLYKKVNWENIKEDLKTIQNTVNTMKEMHHSINSIWDHFQTSLEESIKRNVPIKNTRKKDGCPWITSDIKRLIRKRDRWYKRSRKSGHSGDNKKFKDLKCTTQKEIRRAYWKYIDGIMSSETESELETRKRDNTMKRFSTFIKHKRSDGRQIPPFKIRSTPTLRTSRKSKHS